MEYKKSSINSSIFLNSIRVELGNKTFSSVQLRTILKKKKVSYPVHLAAMLIDNGIIERREKGVYGFVNPEKPIHIKLIDEFINKARQSQRNYSEKYLSKKTIELPKEVIATTIVLTSDGLSIPAVERTDLRIVESFGKLVIVDKQNNIFKVIN